MTNCTWLVKRPTYCPEPDFPEDTYRIEDCGAPVTFRDTGWDCEAGHEYTDMQTRYEQGWDYPEYDEFDR